MKPKGKPTFQRQNAHRKRRVSKKGWRRPRGEDSKQKRSMKYMGAKPTVGYGNARAKKGLHPTGLAEVRVRNVKDLETCDPKKHIIRIAATVGNKKKIEIVKAADSKKFKIINKKTFEKKKKVKKVKVEEKKKEEVNKPKEEPKKEEKKPEEPKKEEKK